MQLQSCHARHVANAAEVRANFVESRARLWAAKPWAPIVVAPVIVEAPAMEPIDPTSPLVWEIIDAVAAALDLTRDTLMSSIEDGRARHGRLVAIVLIMRRLDIPGAVVADIFGVLPDVIRHARQMIKPILVAEAIPLNAPLNATIQVVLSASAREPSYRFVDIRRVVCEIYKVSCDDIISDRRTWNIVRPRQVAMALGKHLTGRSLPYIGVHMGGRDHTTVLHAIRKLQPYIDAISPKMPAGAPISDWVVALREAIP